MNIRQNCSK